MIDPVTASIAVFLVSSFIGKVGEGFANRFGEKLADKTGEILQTLKDNFISDDYANLTLLRLEENPEDEGRQLALEHVIKERMNSDAGFAELLTRQIQDAKAVDNTNVIASGERSVSIGGNVNNSTINTGDSYNR